MATPNLTDEQLESLTDEEREALLEEFDEGQNEPDDTDDDTAAPSPEEQAAASDDDTAPTLEATVEDGTVKVVEPELPQAQPEQAQSSLPKYELPEDFDDRLAAVASAQDELAQRFDDGELTAREYNSQLRELNAQERELDGMKIKAEIYADSVAEAEEREASLFETQKENWGTTCRTWLDAAGHQLYKPGTAAIAALNDEVQRLQGERIAVGASQFDPQVLEQAHRNVTNMARQMAGLDPLPDYVPANKPAPKPGREKRPHVPTLNELPASEGPTFDDGGKFSFIDRLDGVEYENALARLSDAERDVYLARAG